MKSLKCEFQAVKVPIKKREVKRRSSRRSRRGWRL